MRGRGRGRGRGGGAAPRHPPKPVGGCVGAGGGMEGGREERGRGGMGMYRTSARGAPTPPGGRRLEHLWCRW